MARATIEGLSSSIRSLRHGETVQVKLARCLATGSAQPQTRKLASGCLCEIVSVRPSGTHSVRLQRIVTNHPRDFKKRAVGQKERHILQAPLVESETCPGRARLRPEPPAGSPRRRPQTPCAAPRPRRRAAAAPPRRSPSSPYSARRA